MDKRRYYVGVRGCGCITAMLIDDEHTTAKEIADFARRMQRSKRRMEHRETTIGDDGLLFKPCPHGKRPNA